LTDLLATDALVDAGGHIPLRPYGLRWRVGEGRI
jgi:hypothetical protein